MACQTALNKTIRKRKMHMRTLENKLSTPLATLLFYVLVTVTGALFYDSIINGSVQMRQAVSGVVNYIGQGTEPPRATAGGHSPDKVEALKLATLAQVLINRFKLRPTLAVSIVTHAQIASSLHDIPVTLLLAVMAQESSFKPGALNDNDWGLMQVNAKWHFDKVEAIGGKLRLYDPSLNIKVGSAILADYLKISGNYWGALRRYNGLGKANNYPDEVLAKMYVFDNELTKVL
jgi:hypothetical protein